MTPISPAYSREDLIAMIRNRDALISDLKATTAANALVDSLHELLEPYEGMEPADLFAKLPGEEAQRVVRARAALASEPVAGTVEGLAARCGEILDWDKTGLLIDGELRKMAAELAGEEIPEDQRLNLAELKTTRQAMHEVVRYAALSAPPAPAGREEIRQCPMSDTDLIDLANVIDETRDAYLNHFGTLKAPRLKLALEETLWNDMGSFAPALRELADRRAATTITPHADRATASAPERTMVVGRNTKILHEGNQCHGMPHAICHACGLGYKCFNADCPNDQPNPMFAPTTPAPGAADRAEWQPIETAPRDGTRILLFQKGRGAFEGWWHDDWPHAEHYWTDDRDSEPEPSNWRPLLAAPTLPRAQRGVCQS